MKITMLSEIDYAGSGHKLCQAIKRHTEHDIEIFTGKYYNPFGLPDNSKWDREKVQERISSSDIIHLKGDFPPKNGKYMGFKISHKPVVITVSGSHFRKKEYGGYEKYSLSQYKDVNVRTAFTPDLLYEGFDIWTPHPVDSSESKNIWNKQNLSRQLMLHIPSRKEIKGTDFNTKVFSRLENYGMNCITRTNLSHKEAVELRKKCTIYFDQFHVGFYGNSAIEAMQFGIPVAAWIRNTDHPSLIGCPVITVDKDVDMWVNEILSILGGNMEILSKRTKDWCDAKHSYQAVAHQWNDIYELTAI